MDTTAYGGSCPSCHNHLLQKFSKSNTGFHFDACLWCGYANGDIPTNNFYKPQLISKAIWSILINHHLGEDISESSFLNQLERLRYIYNIDISTSPDPIAHYPTLFILHDYESVQAFKPYSFLNNIKGDDLY